MKKTRIYQYNDFIVRPNIWLLGMMVISLLTYLILLDDIYLSILPMISLIFYGWSISFGEFELKKNRR